MPISRRDFVQTLGWGAAATLLPCAGRAIVEPQGGGVPQTGSAIFLNNNESAYGPSEKTIQAMHHALDSVNRYIGSQVHRELIETIAKLHHVPPDHVLPGCGSHEILRLACSAFLRPGAKLVMARPSYEAVASYGRSMGAEIAAVPITKEFAHDLPKMLAGIDDKKQTLVYICNPNNPTATLTVRKELETFLEKLPAKAYALVDEAYHHFAEPSASYVSLIDRPVANPRVIVTRTFSMIYGLAGIRLGYGVAAPEVIQRMQALQTSFSVSKVAAMAGIAALQDAAGLEIAIQRNADDRQEFLNEAFGRALKPLPSHTNFAMTSAGVPAQQIIDHFKSHNIMIGGPFPSMDSHVRISFGLPAEMREFWRVWDLMGLHPQGHH